MKHVSIALAAVLLLSGSATVLMADEAPGNGPAVVPDKGVIGPHPRLDEVFKRLGMQNKEILAKEKSGGMTYHQGDALDLKDRKIRMEVRVMEEKGGDLTRSELRRLESQLNDVRMLIRSE
jgi:hypothetical protein